MPFSSVSFLAIASRANLSPGVGAYFVMPFSSAAIAACLMFDGVSKSGSPIANAITSCPFARAAAAFAPTARVADSVMAAMRDETNMRGILLIRLKREHCNIATLRAPCTMTLTNL